MLHIFSIFPNLLDLGWFLGVLYLRIVVASTHLFLAYKVIRATSSTNNKSAKLVGAIQIILGALLFIGLFTQMVGLLLFILSLVAALSHDSKIFRKETKMFYVFLGLVSLVFVFLGAGAYAFDYPL